jgi:flagellar biosynthetic protein FliQ
MDMTDVIEIIRESIIVMLKIAGPIMLVAMAVGLIISLFQALTQIQEVTLTFVPKILAVFAVMLIMGPFIVTELIDFTRVLADRIIAIG